MENIDGMNPVVLQLTDVHLERGSRPILSGLSLTAARGERLAIMGPSGSGKTTVLRAIAALESFQSGQIAVDGVVLEGGRPPKPAALRALRRKVGLVFQFHCLFEHLTALENICLAPVHVHRLAAADAERRAHDLLSLLGVDHRARALPRELSGGEAQRVAIARALAVDPQILLMDEPTASLDPARRDELGDLLKQLVSQGRTLVVATHDEEFARAHATAIIRMAPPTDITVTPTRIEVDANRHLRRD
jgi:ABC-type polar amino acid transport system ATPase subunit